MSVTTQPDTSVAEVLGELGRRVYTLENRRVLARTATGEARFPGGLVVGPSDDPVVADEGVPNAATGLTLTAGATFDDVFVDVSWTAPASGPTPVGYDVVVAESGVGIVSVDRVGGTSFRARGLKPNTTYTVTVYAIGKLGEASPGTSGNVATVGDTTDPAQTTGVTVSAGLRAIVVRWNESADPDVAGGSGVYSVELSRSTDGTTWSVVETRRTSATIVAVADLPRVDGTGAVYSYRARVQAIDASGNAGPWSTYTAGVSLAQADTPDLAVGAITADSAIVASLDAAVIVAGTITGDKIAANTITASKLTTSTLTATTITLGTGGIIRANSPGGSLYIDADGIELYSGADGTGSRTVFLDATTGNASFTGTITATAGTVSGTLTVTGKLRSASSGSRIEIGANAYSSFTPGDAINLYDANDALTSPAGRIWARDNDLEVSTKRKFTVWDENVLSPMFDVDVPAGVTTMQTGLVVNGGPGVGITVAGKNIHKAVGAEVRHTIGTSATSGTWTTLTTDSQVDATGGAARSTSGVSIPGAAEPGWYAIHATACFVDVGVNTRCILDLLNDPGGAAYRGRMEVAAVTVSPWLVTSALVYIDTDVVIAVRAWQNSGASKTVRLDSLSVVRVSPVRIT